jgi:hypothetical protein
MRLISAARRRGEQPFEDDQGRPVFDDGLERLNRLRVREYEKLPVIRQALPQRRHQIGSGNHDCWRRHRSQSIKSPRRSYNERQWYGPSSSIWMTRSSIIGSAPGWR